MPDIDAFIDRWKAAGGTELANYQLFLTDLAALLDLPRPEPATGDPRTVSSCSNVWWRSMLNALQKKRAD